MAKKFFYNKVYNTKRMIINGIIIGVCIIGILICFIVVSNFKGESHLAPAGNLTIKSDVSVEVNESYTNEIFFSEIENVDLDDIKINYSLDYDPSKIGSYVVSIIVDNNEHQVNLNVVDTTRPHLNLKDLKINSNKSYTINDFVESCSDNSNLECKLSYACTDEEGNAKDCSKFTKDGEYEIKISATDSSGNEIIKSAKLTIGNKKPVEEKPNTEVNPPATTCKYGNNTYDKTLYLLATDISTNGCAISLDLYKSETMTQKINKIMDTETAKIKRDVEALNLTGTLSLNRKVTAIVNTTGNGIVGYELSMIVKITNNGETKTVVEYKVNPEGNRVFITNPYQLKK